MVAIRDATTTTDFDNARRLTYTLIGWLQHLYPAAHDLFEQDRQAVAATIDAFAGVTGLPVGKLLVADSEGTLVGTVALRDRGQGICEMQQMFVDPSYRGQGIGRALATALIDDARRLGYKVMRLSTGVKQVAAQQLYRSLGFQEIAPYHAVPDVLRSYLVFMALPL